MAEANDEVEVGGQGWISRARLRGLRRVVEVLLAERGEKHHDAATRAGVSRQYWSGLMNAKRLTQRELDYIARGVGLTTAELEQRCAC
jgi:hypothetical protein